ncbi:1,6-anhydro-N-acetylmuramyl-L-alanine amidase AmpD [Alteromonadales bacterium alter-6D02]|nr:1,6-anhydro-N-acetylmuramyl-L-alanine amidase AmpD [Alteromonadales bacterium alter-6D02]
MNVIDRTSKQQYQASSINNTGWLTHTRHCPSPHFNQRPMGCAISLLVIHNISLPPGKFGGSFIDHLFQGTLDCNADPFFADLEGLRVSAHCMINRTGEVTQYVAFNERAWHAGVSSFEGMDNCNDYSIGIELEGTDTTPYTPAQYVTLATLTKKIQQAYPNITNHRITGHSDIAPGRKTDPGAAFDWGHFRELLALS